MKNGDSDCTGMEFAGKYSGKYSPFKNWCLRPMCVSVMDVNTPEEQKGIMAPPYHTHICMYDQVCGYPFYEERTAAVNAEETITFMIRCASVNMLAASAASLLAIAYNF